MMKNTSSILIFSLFIFCTFNVTAMVRYWVPETTFHAESDQTPSPYNKHFKKMTLNDKLLMAIMFKDYDEVTRLMKKNAWTNNVAPTTYSTVSVRKTTASDAADFLDAMWNEDKKRHNALCAQYVQRTTETAPSQ